MSWGGRTDLHLRIRVDPQRLPALLDFLRDAVPFYESPGGIKVRLLQNLADPAQFIELVEYSSAAAYDADQKRVESDPAMRSLLERWRGLLAEPPRVETWRDITSQIPPLPNAADVPTLTTDRLTLRAYRTDDAEELARLIGDREVADTLLLVPHPYSLDDAHAFIGRRGQDFREGKAAIFLIADRETGAQLGGGGFKIERDFGRAELGYWIGRPYWGRGYATEAARAMLGYGFGTLGGGLNRIWAGHFARNPQSGRIMHKLGMKHEGVLRKHYKRWGKWEDSVVYAILREDWTG